MTTTQTVLRTALGGLFLGAGAIQATHRELFTALMPPRFSTHARQLQAVATGALAGIGVSFLIPRLRSVARWSATVMLGATLPAAVGQVRKPEETAALGLPPTLVALRIPAQLAVIAAAWIATQNTHKKNL